jgi:hypothetical protein
MVFSSSTNKERPGKIFLFGVGEKTMKNLRYDFNKKRKKEEPEKKAGMPLSDSDES